MSILPNPISVARDEAKRAECVALAGKLAPRQGYNPTQSALVRILRTETVLHDVPVLYRPGVVFVMQGRKQGLLEGEVFLYDEDHYLAVSIPVPFRMESHASPERALLAVYVEFDMALASEIASEMERLSPEREATEARSLVSSRIDPDLEDAVFRLLKALSHPVESAIIGQSILRELHYRILVGPQGAAMVAALQQQGASGRIVKSVGRLRETFRSEISVADLAADAGMSVPSYHVHFKALTGSSPMQYVKAMRLHEARLMMARQDRTIAEIALAVGYVSPAQFSRDFKRHFLRTASEEIRWARLHLGEYFSEAAAAFSVDARVHSNAS